MVMTPPRMERACRWLSSEVCGNGRMLGSFDCVSAK